MAGVWEILADGRFELVDVEGLGKERVARVVSGFAVRAHDDDGGRGELFVELHLAGELDAVHSREADVDDDEVGTLHLDDLRGGLGVRGGEGFAVQAAQDGNDDPQDRWFVLYHKHRHRVSHRPASSLTFVPGSYNGL